MEDPKLKSKLINRNPSCFGQKSFTAVCSKWVLAAGGFGPHAAEADTC